MSTSPRSGRQRGTQTQRWRAVQRGAATFRLVRYAGHFVVLVLGPRQHTEDLFGEVQGVLDQLGLRLAPEKTKVAGIDEGFDFLGFHIQRHRQKGSNRRLIYTHPSKKSLATMRRKVSEATDRNSIGLDPRVMFHRLGQITRGWALY